MEGVVERNVELEEPRVSNVVYLLPGKPLVAVCRR
jgi:hypothetical protein